MAPVVKAAQPDLTLSPTELWAIRHVLLECLRTGHTGSRSPQWSPADIRDALGKIEDGACHFTRPELRNMRMVLQEYLHRSSQTTPDVVAAGRAIDTITDALT